MLAGHDICSAPPGEQEAAAASWSQAAAGNYRLAPGLHRDKLITGVLVSLSLLKVHQYSKHTRVCNLLFCRKLKKIPELKIYSNNKQTWS